MAEKNQPQFHDYSDALDGKHRVNNYDELLRRAQLKKADLMRTKAWVQEQASIDDYVSIIPSAELALVEHYSAMPEVEMDPGIKEFWLEKQDALGKIDLQGPQEEYMSAYKEWQELVEIMDDKKRAELGSGGIAAAERQAKQGIKDAKERLKEAKQRSRDVESDVSPFSVMLGALTGANKDAKTYMEAKKGVGKAKKGLKDARKRLAEIRERKADLKEKQDKYSVKEHMALEKMNDALEKMANNQALAAEIDANSKEFAQKLHQQYQTIDKFKSIQTLKQSTLNDVDTRNSLKLSNPELFEALEGLPESLPAKSIKVTLDGPIQLPDNTSKIADIDSKIEDIKKHLPSGVNLDNLESIANEITKLKLKETDTKDSIEAEMSTLDPSSQEYKQLEMKRNHLVLQEKYNNTKKTIEQLKRDIVSADPKNQQRLLKKLSDQQQILGMIKEQLDKDPYSKTLKGFEDLQSLMQQKEALKSQDNLQNLDDISTQIEASNLPAQSSTLSQAYELIIKAIEEQRQKSLLKLEKKYQKLPLEKNQEQAEPDQNDGSR